MRDHDIPEKFKNPYLRALLLATGDAHLRLHVDFEDDWKALGHELPCPECKNTGYTSDNLCSCPLGDTVTLNFQGRQYQGAALRALLTQSPAILSPFFTGRLRDERIPPAEVEELIRSLASGSLVFSSGGGGSSSVVTEAEFRVMAAIIRAYAPEGVYNAVLRFDNELTPVEVDNLTERIHAAAPMRWIDLHSTDTDTPSSGDQG